MLAISNPYYMCSSKPQEKEDKSKQDKPKERCFSLPKYLKRRKFLPDYVNLPRSANSESGESRKVTEDLLGGPGGHVGWADNKFYVNKPCGGCGPVCYRTVSDPSLRVSAKPFAKFDHKLENANLRCVRKQCPSCIKGGYSSEKTVDVAIFHGQDGQVWGEYLNACFKKLSPNPDFQLRSFTTSCESIESLELPLTNAKIEQVQSSKLQLVVLSPGFLDHVFQNPSAVIGQLFSPDKVLALLVGVDSRKDVKEEHRAALPSYVQWKKMNVKEQDTAFIEDVIVQATKIIMKSTPSSVEQKPIFKLSERKIREGESKLFIILDQPLTDDDCLKIYVEKGGSSRGYLFQVASMRIINPYTIKFQVPDTHLTMSSLINVHVFKNECSLGVRPLKYESKLSELGNYLKCVNNPIESMCQSLGLSGESRDVLDETLANTLKENMIPTHSSLLDFSRQVKSKKTKEEFPTLLHFAARYGLKELTSVILDCPGAEAACRIRNRCGCTPNEMASAAGFKNLADILNNFVETYQLSHLYTHLAQACQSNDEDAIYESIKGILDSQHLYSSLSEEEDKQEGHAEQPGTTDDAYLVPNPLARPLPPLPQEEEALHTYCSMTSCLDPQTAPSVKDSRPSRTTSLQQELIEIMEGFRANYFTIREVELLFQDWMSRSEVKRSFEQKELQLRKMRQLYTEAIKQQSENIKSRYTVSPENPLGKLLSLISRKGAKKKDPSACMYGPKSADEREDCVNRPLSQLSTVSSERSSRSSLMSRGSSTDGEAWCEVKVDPGGPRDRPRSVLREGEVALTRPGLPLPREQLSPRDMFPSDSYIDIFPSDSEYMRPDSAGRRYPGVSRSTPSSPTPARRHEEFPLHKSISIDLRPGPAEYLEMSAAPREVSAPDIRVSPALERPNRGKEAAPSPPPVPAPGRPNGKVSSGVRRIVFPKFWGAGSKKSHSTPPAFFNDTDDHYYVNVPGQEAKPAKKCRIFKSPPPPLPPRNKL